MKVDVYTAQGKKSGSATLSDQVFGQDMNADLLHQVLVSMQSNAREGNAHTKDRSEVSGTGKKPWRQKGTGRARHGSRRSPIWVGGGVSFGPRSSKKYSKKINKKMRVKALCIGLSLRLQEGSVLFVDSLNLSEGKTKEVASAIHSFGSLPGFETIDTRSNPNNVLIIDPSGSELLVQASRNIPHVSLTSGREVSVLDIAQSRYVVVLDPEALSHVLEARLSGTYGASFAVESDTASESVTTA